MVFFNGVTFCFWLSTFVSQAASSGLLEIKRGMREKDPVANNIQYKPPPPLGSDDAFTDCPCLAGITPGYGSCRSWEDETASGLHGRRCTNKELLGAIGYECGAHWCYVNKNNCSREVLENPAAGLAFSFATCGNLSHHVWIEEPALKNKELRVWAAGHVMSSNPMRTGARYFNSQAMLVFAHEVFGKLGMNEHDVKYRNLSTAALDAYPNDFTSCVYDIALGSIDMCLGVCFDTPLRRDLRVPFSSTIFSETFQLVVPSDQASRLMNSVAKPFAPFTPALWFCIVLVIVFAGLSQLVFDEGCFSKLVVRDEDGEIPSTQKVFYESIVSFLSQGLSYSPETLSGRIFAVGYGFFILVIGASYTANLASILITQKGLLISTIDDALSYGKKICYYTGTMKSLNDKYPGLQEHGVPINDMQQIPSELEKGSCWAAIMAKDWLQTSQAASQLCGYEMTPEVLLSVPAGYWVSERLADVVSWQVANETVHGTWDRVAASAFRASMCADMDVANTALEVHHCIGVMAVVGAFFFLALLLRSWELGGPSKLVRLATARDSGTTSGSDDSDSS